MRYTLLSLFSYSESAICCVRSILFIEKYGFCSFIIVFIIRSNSFYFKVPKLLGGMLDKRSAGIQVEIDEARSLRDEAQSLLASYERKQKEAMEQAERILETAKADASAAAEQAKIDLKDSVARRMAAAEERISTAQASAEKEVRDAAIKVAVAAASEVVAKQLTSAESNKLIDAGS